MDAYTGAVQEEIKSFAGTSAVDTIYFGGGTPSLLGAGRLTAILETVTATFSVVPGAEVTVEVNPGDDLRCFFRDTRRAGWNRLSIGMQSADEGELLRLGRRHNAVQAAKTVEAALQAGYGNLSLDLMLAVGGQTRDSLRRSIAAYAALGASHVSAYLLKIEDGTPYARRAGTLRLPGEEAAAALYLVAYSELERYGFSQYEISNFAKPGMESRHNLKYWRDMPYLGFGPAAHSFFAGKRSYHTRSLKDYCAAPLGSVPDGAGGSLEEFFLLGLRLCNGIRREDCERRFGAEGRLAFERLLGRACRFAGAGLTVCTKSSVRLTRRGFLVSNALLAGLLE